MCEGSTASYLARTPCVPVFLPVLIGPEAKGRLDFQGRRGIDHFCRAVEPLPGHIRRRNSGVFPDLLLIWFWRCQSAGSIHHVM